MEREKKYRETEVNWGKTNIGRKIEKIMLSRDCATPCCVTTADVIYYVANLAYLNNLLI